jgi:hydroxymethylbilane synthase
VPWASRLARTTSRPSSCWPASTTRRPSAASSAERAFLAALEGSCRTPIAALAELDGDSLTFRGLVARPDGTGLRRTERRASAADAEVVGAVAGAEIRAGLPADYFAQP